MLEEICSVEVTRHAHRWMAVVGCVVLLASAAWAGSLGLRAMRTESLATMREYESSAWETLLWGAVLSGVFFVAYFLTRYRVVMVASAGAEIPWVVERRGAEYVAGFVDQVEMAKNQRFMLLAQTAEVKPANEAGTSGGAGPAVA